jgi:hypothetical protein
LLPSDDELEGCLLFLLDYYFHIFVTVGWLKKDEPAGLLACLL